MSDTVQVISYKRRVEKATEDAMKKAATMIGGAIEGHAKELCPVDTGLLRNSITYALGGSEVNQPSYKSNDKDKTGKQITAKEGEYSGTAERDTDGQVTVYVGSNVQYAPYQELGAPSINLPAKPYLRPAFENNENEIEQIIRLCFKDI